MALTTGSKLIAFCALNLVFAATVIVGAAMNGGDTSKLAYVALMFAICTSPLPFIRSLNGPVAILTVATTLYFAEFALLDTVRMFSSSSSLVHSSELLDLAEVIILAGVVCKIGGFAALFWLWPSRVRTTPAKDWPREWLVPIGLLLWIAGNTATIAQSLFIIPDNTDASTIAGFAKLGTWGTTGLLLVANYAGPLGVMILAYWWSVTTQRSATALIIFVIVAQFIVGWIVDTKEIAVAAPLIIFLTRLITQGRLPVKWLVCGLLGVALVFPVLTAKRLIVTEALHLTRLEAVPRSFEILWRAISERDVVAKGIKYDQASQNFIERFTDKGAIGIFAAHMGVDHPYRMGDTLDQLLYTFAPRVFWAEKPGGNSSQLFNREFHLSEDPDTHISPSHLGELYWNFGMPGVVVGMTLLGLLLAYVTVAFDPSQGASITRVLVIMVTIYDVVVRGGGQLELEYVVWIRTMLLIGVLHFALARAPRSTGAVDPKIATNRLPTAGHDLTERAAIRYPNLLR